MERPIWSGYRVGKSGGGLECEGLERETEGYYDTAYSRVFNSATSALHSALEALNVRGGDVIVPAYTMSASAAAIIHAGGEPVFADIGEDYCLDWEDVRRRITSQTRAIVLVHLFGHHASVPGGINLPIVHDAAQSPSLRPATFLGASSPARNRDIFVYSLNQHKIITCGEGGYALTFSGRLATRMHAVRNHGECYTEDILGYNYRMTELAAHIARNEFRELDFRLDERKRWAEKMTKETGITDPGNVDWFLFPIRSTEGREVLARRLGGRVGYHTPLYKLPYFASHGWGKQHLPMTERIEAELVVVDPLLTRAA